MERERKKGGANTAIEPERVPRRHTAGEGKSSGTVLLPRHPCVSAKTLLAWAETGGGPSREKTSEKEREREREGDGESERE